MGNPWTEAKWELEERGFNYENIASYRLGTGKLQELHQEASAINGLEMERRKSLKDWDARAISVEERAFLLALMKGKCYMCSNSFVFGSSKIHLDHVNPQYVVRANEDTHYMQWSLNNLRVSCNSCNARKKNSIHALGDQVSHFIDKEGVHIGAVPAGKGYRKGLDKEYRAQGGTRLNEALIVKSIYERDQKAKEEKREVSRISSQQANEESTAESSESSLSSLFGYLKFS